MASTSHWDVIVLGLGGVGSAAAYHASRAGLRVLGIDQFPPAHDRGSSHGQTRVIRQAYFESPAYVPMLRRAYELWKSLQEDAGRQLYYQTGLVEIGPADGVVIPGVLRSAQEHDLDIETLSVVEFHRRWPGLRANESWSAVVERDAGYLRVEACVRAHLDAAKKAGATCRHNETVHNWTTDDNSVVVETNLQRYVADRLIIAAGPWSNQVLASLNLPLKILRKHQYWFRPCRDGYELDQGFPCFFFETPPGYFYGFPSIDGGGVKVARHSGGELIEAPDTAQAICHEDLQLVNEFVANHLPSVGTDRQSHVGCFYTVTPDEHFVIDTHPQHAAVTVIAGLSGHGFKFTSVLGEIAAALAIGKSPTHDLSLFQLRRFSAGSTHE